MIIHDYHNAAAILNQGQLVAIPTETVYGLAANGFDGNAIAQIYEVKNRPQFNPLILHSNSLERFKSWGIHLPDEALKLAQAFSPGPITFVVPKSDTIPDIVTAGHSSVAIRIPNHPTTLKLLAMLNFPLAAPSANLSGTVSPTTAQHVNNQLGELIGAVLEGGECEIGLESTIISFVNEQPQLLRLGGLSIEAIEEVLGMALDKSKLINNDNPEAPGMLSKHYAPNTPLRIGKPEDFIEFCDYTQMAYIGFNNLNPNLKEEHQLILSEQGNLEEAAQKLFAAIRQADALNLKLIVADYFPDEHLGRAINDRLARAAKN
ncbi:MAG: threonylcarbamoyl-AMP synthase [Bacteroidetes bacterium B1(2017)]|nr:MAG: threonylcarbamoyl-AMP synthase [Bacteroidetes bacterium B1(2017)]